MAVVLGKTLNKNVCHGANKNYLDHRKYLMMCQKFYCNESVFQRKSTCGYQVSCDWWIGAHVTRSSSLIGCDCQGKKGDARRHEEARHVEDMSILCSHCAKPFKTRERTHRIINWIKTRNWVWFNPRLWWRYNLMASIVVKWMNNCAVSHSRIPNYLDNRSRVKQWWYKSTKSFKNLIMPWKHESLLQVCDDLQIQSLRRRECASIQSQSSAPADTKYLVVNGEEKNGRKLPKYNLSLF